ncbi:PREDICTED: peroxisomal 2,4-dienoyl-CoA reductase-like [Branchiostoma belcheri]|uniref:Peroxisomal 2,4-dienoyl-CoA reductase [(3E)-enoyl-CoA-producing] n=1 Tax=Branchiostoma belcheri TaxID=7741 RepID=A0A6P4XSH8_BRABE|nr:PREDICTED: peroxisomal 2,4-dienoyl-CoA reductase-like [Branchiostoma belcheri]
MAEGGDFDVCLQTYEYIYRRDLLKGKVAFITGGGSGIGFRIAEIFMRHQCSVVIASRNLEKVKAAAAKLEKATGGKCLALPMDVRKADQILAAVDAALSHFNRIDILVNNAAGNFLCPAGKLSFNAFKTVMEIDAHGSFNCSKAVFDKYMKDHGGSIVNITATLHHRGVALQTHAGSAKAAIDAMTRHLAVEWGQYGIRINCVAPGPIDDTEGMRRLGGAKLKKMTGSYERLIREIPVGRIGTKEDIANGCLYLVSPAGSFVTGTNLIVDGGNWLTQNITAMLGKL